MKANFMPTYLKSKYIFFHLELRLDPDPIFFPDPKGKNSDTIPGKYATTFWLTQYLHGYNAVTSFQASTRSGSNAKQTSKSGSSTLKTG